MKALTLAVAALVLSTAAQGDPLWLPFDSEYQYQPSLPWVSSMQEYSVVMNIDARASSLSTSELEASPSEAIITSDIEPDSLIPDASQRLAGTLPDLSLYVPEPPTSAMLLIGIALLYGGIRSKQSLRHQRHLSPLRRRVKTVYRMMAA